MFFFKCLVSRGVWFPRGWFFGPRVGGLLSNAGNGISNEITGRQWKTSDGAASRRGEIGMGDVRKDVSGSWVNG